MNPSTLITNPSLESFNRIVGKLPEVQTATNPKYVIVDRLDGIESPRLLQSWEQHCDVVKEGQRVVSAGFFRIDSGRVHVWGASISLKVESRPEDAELIGGMLAP